MRKEVKAGKLRKWLIRLMHLWFLASRPMTLGVRVLVHDRESQSVLLVRHTYIPGWHLPGGGVEPGETLEEAVRRELMEEAGIEAAGIPRLVSMHFNRNKSRRDHVAFFIVDEYREAGKTIRSREIAESGFFPLGALPSRTSADTLRRIEEYSGQRPADGFW